MMDDPDFTLKQAKQVIEEMQKNLRKSRLGSPEWCEMMDRSMEMLLGYLISRLEAENPELENLDE